MVSMAQDAILKACASYYYLTIDQIMYLLDLLSLRYTQRQLKQLKDAGYLERIHRHKTGTSGKLTPAYTYTLQTKRYLEEQGLIVHPPRVPKAYFLDHTLALNDVLIAGRVLAEKHVRWIDLSRMVHEQELKRWSLPSVVPDAYMLFEVVVWDDHARTLSSNDFPILIEVDMGTQDQAAWQRKIERYCEFFPATLQEHFGIDVATVAVLTTDGSRRVANLKRWTEQVLKRLDREELGALFLFGATWADMTPEELYLDEHFAVAFGGDREHPLLVGTIIGEAED